MSKSAPIYKIGNTPTSPDLLLEMCRANYPNAESVVVSIVNDGQLHTFRSTMQNNDLAFHIYGIQYDLQQALLQPDVE